MVAANELQTFFIGTQTIILLVAAIASVMELRSLSAANRKDHHRRAQQATFDYLNGILQQMRELKRQVPIEPPAQVAAFKTAARQLDSDEYRAFVDYFNLFENLASGVVVEVFDFETVYRLSASKIRRIWDTYADLVEWDRTRPGGWPVYLIDLQEVSKRIAREMTVRGDAYVGPAEAPADSAEPT